jgi:hypothetical protein
MFCSETVSALWYKYSMHECLIILQRNGGYSEPEDDYDDIVESGIPRKNRLV